jgi:hypothetical protein
MIKHSYLRSGRRLIQIIAAGIYKKNTDLDKETYDAKKAEDDLLI